MESKGFLLPDMLVKLDMEGNVLSAPYVPSTESKMHIDLYRENSRITAVVHSHPPIATAYACFGKNVPTLLLPESISLFGKELVVAPFAMPGTDDVPASVRPYANSHHAVLLANHGALTWAASLKEAYFLMETLEQYCKTYMIADKFIGSPNPVPKDSAGLLIMHHEMIMDR
jgi:L-fuculose-phosphate aldolase